MTRSREIITSEHLRARRDHVGSAWRNAARWPATAMAMAGGGTGNSQAGRLIRSPIERRA
jgi:hypothetical protein